MKKYEIKDLEEALKILSITDNIVISEFSSKISEEIKKRKSNVFVKATDEYLKKLKREDVYIRRMTEEDEYFYKGMYGMFQKSNNKLLRRHTDTGFFTLPK